MLLFANWCALGGVVMLANRRKKRLQYLMENAGPTIRHLLFQRFDIGSNEERTSNYEEMLALPVVAKWRSLIPNEISASTLLGSSDGCFENAFGKLLQFGLAIEDILTAKQRREYLRYLEVSTNDDIYAWLARYVVASYFSITGEVHPTAVTIVTDRLQSLHSFVSSPSQRHNIFVDSLHAKLPKAYEGRKLINPGLYASGELCLPLVHDVFVFSHLYEQFDNEQRRQVGDIIDFIADKKYQSIDYGYGMVRSNKNKWHAMGWSAHMPLFNEQLSTAYFHKGLVFRAGLFSRLRNQKSSKWLASVFNTFEKFKIDDFRFSFPGELMPETPNSYYLNGRHLGLNENRRQKEGRIIESTYYAHLVDIYG